MNGHDSVAGLINERVWRVTLLFLCRCRYAVDDQDIAYGPLWGPLPRVRPLIKSRVWRQERVARDVTTDGTRF